MTTQGPLQDIRILAIEQYGAGPFATAHLVDLGADVIKVEDPTSGGDVGRSVPPYSTGDASLFFETFNRGKRSISLDLGSPAGRITFESLLKHADAVFANVRGDVPAKLRIRFEDLRHFNEKIVCCFLTAYGMTGTEQDSPGYDYVMQGRAGWMSLTGEPDGPPEKTGLSLVDYSAGLAAALALLAAVHAARQSGVGSDCDVALFDTAIGMLTYVGTWHLTHGYEPVRTANSAHPSLIPFQNFKTADGWLVIACAKEKFWTRLVNLLEDDKLASEANFSTFQLRKQHSVQVLAELNKLFAQRPTTEWLRILQEARIPCAPVNDVKTALADPLVAERKLLVETDHPSLGIVRQLAGPVRVGAFNPVRQRGPFLGEHTAAVLSELLAITEDQLTQLAHEGAFGKMSDAYKSKKVECARQKKGEKWRSFE